MRACINSRRTWYWVVCSLHSVQTMVWALQARTCCFKRLAPALGLRCSMSSVGHGMGVLPLKGRRNFTVSFWCCSWQRMDGLPRWAHKKSTVSSRPRVACDSSTYHVSVCTRWDQHSSHDTDHSLRRAPECRIDPNGLAVVAKSLPTCSTLRVLIMNGAFPSML